MRDTKLCNAIGLAMKAGKLVSGDFAAEKTIRANRAKLILLDADASDNTADKYGQLARAKGCGLVSVEALGDAIGKPARMVAAVTDDNFKKLILGAVQGADGNETTRG